MYMIIMNDGVPITVIRGMWGKKKDPLPYPLHTRNILSTSKIIGQAI